MNVAIIYFPNRGAEDWNWQDDFVRYARVDHLIYTHIDKVSCNHQFSGKPNDVVSSGLTNINQKDPGF